MAPTMTPDDLYRIAWAGECAMSPDGSRVAFTVSRLDREDDATHTSIWVVDATGGGPRAFTSGAHDSAPRWSPDGRWLAFLRREGRVGGTAEAEARNPAQIFVMPSGGGEARAVTSRPLGAGVPVWAPDSRRIGFAGRTGTPPPPPDDRSARPFRRIDSTKYRLNGEGFTYDRRRHIFVLDLDLDDPSAVVRQPRQVTRGAWDDTAPAWSPDGRRIAFLSARQRTRDEDTHNQLWVVDVPATGRAPAPRLVADADGSGGAPAWAPDGRRIAQTFHAETPGNSMLRILDLRGRATAIDATFDRNTPAETGAPVWLDDRRVLAVAEDRGTASAIVAEVGRPTRWLGAGRHQISAISVATDRLSAAVVLSTVTEPPEVYRLDLESGTLTRLTHLNRAWRREVRTTPAQHLLVRTAPGVEVDTWIMKPAGWRAGRTYPVLLNVHGGPFGQYGEVFLDEFQVYTGAGYGVVFCNPRGGSGQSSDFASAIVGDLGGADYTDVMAAFEGALRRMPWADQRRLGVIGGSYGGFMTSWIVGHSDRFAAACSERAVNDWYLMQGTSDIGQTFNQRYLGERAVTFDDLDAVLRQSPTTYARAIRTPLLILHSENDLRCPISQAEALYVILKKLRRDVEFVRVPDETHELSRSGRPSHRVARFEVILDYFARKLAPRPRARRRTAAS